jgi:hypothetical protein
MTNDADFTRFDRELEDLRNNTSVANLTMRRVVERYVAAPFFFFTTRTCRPPIGKR